MGELTQALVQLKAEGVDEIIVLTTSDATAQDVASALEALRVAKVPRVRLIGRGG